MPSSYSSSPSISLISPVSSLLRTQPAPPAAARRSAAGHGRDPRRDGVDGEPTAAGRHASRDQGGGQRGAEADDERHQPGPRLGVWRGQEEIEWKRRALQKSADMWREVRSVMY